MTDCPPSSPPPTALRLVGGATLTDHSRGHELSARTCRAGWSRSICRCRSSSIVLLFPFYWMALTAIKPDEQLLDMDKFNPFWTSRRPSSTSTSCCSRATIRSGCGTRCTWRSARPCSRSSPACSRPTRSCGCAIAGAQWVGGAIFLAYLVPPSILFIPLSTVIFQYGLFDSPLALILTYPTILIPFSTWLLMGYFKTIPYELEECALIDGASRWQILTKIVLPLAMPGPDLGLHLLLHAVLERVHLRADVPAIGAEQDRAGRDRQRVRRRRHLPLGLADGRRARRLAAAGHPLFVLRRTLRLGA